MAKDKQNNKEEAPKDERPDDNRNEPNGDLPKFNFNWIYVLLALGLIGFQLWNFTSVEQPPISLTTFEEIASNKGVVDRVTVVNKEFAEIYLRDTIVEKYNSKDEFVLKYIRACQMDEEAVRKEGKVTIVLKDHPYFDKARKGNALGGKPNPAYIVSIGDQQAFQTKLDKINEKLPPYRDMDVRFEPDRTTISTIMSFLIPILIFAAIWLFILRRVGGGPGGAGGQLFNIGKSKATLFDQNSKVNINFGDVAGLDEAKEEVMEIVDFLKNPKKYTALGGKIPKGVLLVGPPGTGKTLLAKAVAGEAAVPFFSISGSDFVEMFVGVGASRVRDLFRQAREKAPCIIFIDEIDAIGRARGRGNMQGGNDERENTLNQLLVEMDGFPTDKGVIMMAATNRPDILDAALLRAGRFDRQIGLDRPDLKSRAQIFEVHLKNIKTGEEVKPFQLAEMTPGFVGADIANVCNEAALIAARHGKKAVDIEDFNYALDKVIGGLEKKNKIISPEEKKVIAFHEAGHAVCGWYLEHAHPLVKVTIVPRGIAALGYAQYLPKEEYIKREEKMLDEICMTLGGRAAESIVFDKISTGAQSDLDVITRSALAMVTVYGMSEKVGNVSYYGISQESYDKPYSNATAELIDQEVRLLIDTQYLRAKQLLRDKRKELDALANALLEKEVLHKTDIERLIGARPWIDPEAISHETGEPTPDGEQLPNEH